MKLNTNRSFDRISDNNIKVDEMLDSLVESAAATGEIVHRNDRQELDKTSKLFVFSSLIFGETDSRKDEMNY